MLQRIQTIHFLISMLIIGTLFSGVDFLTFEKKGEIKTMDLFGKTSFQQTAHGKEIVSTETIPLFVIAAGLIILLFIGMMAYKSIQRQLKISRFSLIVHALTSFAFVAWCTYLFVASPSDQSNSISLGFYLMAASLPFTYFAYRGVLRDKMLLDSIDRLR
jgi:amino acid transporter